MKKRIFPALLFALLLALPSCRTAEELPIEELPTEGLPVEGLPAEELPVKDLFDLRQDNWSRCPVTDRDAGKQITVPERYNGYTFQEALQIALRNIDDPHYELVWGEPTVVSPDGKYTVYISNKTDLIGGTFSFMLLNISSDQESVLFSLGDDPIPAYPLWWIDNTRFVYEHNGAYHICNVEPPTQRTEISLKGEKPVMLAYDGSTCLYIENGEGLENAPRQIAVIGADGQTETIAEFTEEQGTLMRESAISEALHLAVMKGRLSADTGERYIRLYDFEHDRSALLPPPPIDGAEQIHAVDLYWQGADLIVHYNVDDISQKWTYHFY